LVVFVHRNNIIPLPALENHVFPYSALIKPSSSQSELKVWLLVKLLSLRPEKRLIRRSWKQNYEYYVRLLKITFSYSLGSIWLLYKAKFRPIRAENLTFNQNFQLRLEIRLISNFCTKKLWNTNLSSWE